MYERARSHGLQRTDGQDLLRFLVHPFLLHVLTARRVSGWPEPDRRVGNVR